MDAFKSMIRLRLSTPLGHFVKKNADSTPNDLTEWRNLRGDTTTLMRFPQVHMPFHQFGDANLAWLHML